jgi:hypothetical protein
MIVLGLILLLPGACAGYFAAMALRTPSDPYLQMLVPLWGLCFGVAAGGVALLIWGFRRLDGRRRKS